jgi:hypothetical protein
MARRVRPADRTLVLELSPGEWAGVREALMALESRIIAARLPVDLELAVRAVGVVLPRVRGVLDAMVMDDPLVDVGTTDDDVGRERPDAAWTGSEREACPVVVRVAGSAELEDLARGIWESTTEHSSRVLADGESEALVRFLFGLAAGLRRDVSDVSVLRWRFRRFPGGFVGRIPGEDMSQASGGVPRVVLRIHPDAGGVNQWHAASSTDPGRMLVEDSLVSEVDLERARLGRERREACHRVTLAVEGLVRAVIDSDPGEGTVAGVRANATRALADFDVVRLMHELGPS